MIGKTKTSCGVIPADAWVVVKPAGADAPPGYVLAQSACDCWRTFHLILSTEVESINGDAITYVYDCQRRGSALLSSSVAGAALGYLECALWSSIDSRYSEGDENGEGCEYNGEPFDKWATLFDCAERLIVHALDCCESFINEGREDFDAFCDAREFHGSDGTVEEHFGHDLWLTRCGHGAGFWDRGLGKLGDKLSERARLLGDVYLQSEPADGASWEDVDAERVVSIG